MRRATCFLLLLAMLNSCTRWVNVPGPIDREINAGTGPQRVRVWTGDSTSVELQYVTVDSASVVGLSADIRRQLITIPRDSVRRVEALKDDGTGSAIVATGFVVGLFVLISQGLGKAIFSGLTLSPDVVGPVGRP